MDPKASAKSKRSHSKHGRQNNPSPSAIAAQKKKPAPAPAGADEKPMRASFRSLPSNWDRYDDDGGEEDDEVGDENPPAGAKAVYGEIKPKSKGADFGFLVEQARSQPPEHRGLGPHNSLFSSSLEEFPFDFIQGAGSMLSTRGEGLLSWLGDDNFVVDDENTSSYEVPFLSMDLHAVASKLSKLKRSQRLFIEADFFPEELYVDESEKSQITCKSEASATKYEHDLATSASLGNPASQIKLDNQHGSCDVSIDCKIPQASTELVTMHVRMPESGFPELSLGRVAQGSTSGRRVGSIPIDEEDQNSKYDAESAEAELDDLLNSLSDISVSSTPAHKLFSNISVQQITAVGSTTNNDPSSLIQESTSAITASSLDDAIDDLLAETSFCIKDKGNTAGSLKEGVAFTTNFLSHSQAGSTSLKNDASLRQVGANALLDDVVDDLLAETSVCQNDQRGSIRQQKQGTLPATTLFSSPSGSKPMDDFDSWLDTL